MIETKCHHCPARDQDRKCLAQITRHARYCQLVDPASPIYNPGYIAVLAADPDCPEPVPAGPTIPLAETLGLIARMKECLHWEASSSCGCGKNKCRQGRGLGGIVVHADCFSCLRETTSPPAAPAEPS